jgi:hypothetical protein
MTRSKRFAALSALCLSMLACRTARSCSCGDPAYPLVGFVIFNQTETTQPLKVEFDRMSCLYCGVLGTVDIFPKIVVDKTLCWKRGQHHITVSALGVGAPRELTFEVKDGTHLLISLDPDGIKVNARYGTLVFL